MRFGKLLREAGVGAGDLVWKQQGLVSLCSVRFFLSVPLKCCLSRFCGAGRFRIGDLKEALEDGCSAQLREAAKVCASLLGFLSGGLCSSRLFLLLANWQLGKAGTRTADIAKARADSFTGLQNAEFLSFSECRWFALPRFPATETQASEVLTLLWRTANILYVRPVLFNASIFFLLLDASDPAIQRNCKNGRQLTVPFCCGFLLLLLCYFFLPFFVRIEEGGAPSLWKVEKYNVCVPDEVIQEETCKCPFFRSPPICYGDV
jgi:hypothetical protein